ncbi:hypothetical protein OG21DRAFT_1526964 [Imleria badia]|nr:hypothetical protein OG21DRAFT_1526964 [Imleria badia]
MSAQFQTSLGDLIAFIILFYDYLLTFPAEVHHFWRRPRCNLALVLFFANRYFALCLHILNVIRIFINVPPDDDKLSSALQTAEQGGIMLVQLISSAIMAMRVYALYEKSRLILTTLFIIAVGVVVFGLWAVFLDPSGTGGNTSTSYMNPGLALHIAIAWAGQLIFDAVIFLLTVWKSYCIGKMGDRLLVDILLRDGSMYFAIISCVNAVNIAMLLLASAQYKWATSFFTNSRNVDDLTFSSSYRVNVIMVSRLVLNLQGPSRRLSVENTEDDGLMMTSVVPLDDVDLSMHVNEPECSTGVR